MMVKPARIRISASCIKRLSAPMPTRKPAVKRNGIAVRIEYIIFVFTITLISINKKTQIDITTEIVVMPFVFISNVKPMAPKSLMIISYSILLLFL